MLGFVTSVVIAWALALGALHVPCRNDILDFHTRTRGLLTGNLVWFTGYRQLFFFRPVTGLVGGGTPTLVPVPRWVIVHPDDPPAQDMLIAVASGWPCLSMAGVHDLPGPGRGRLTGSAVWLDSLDFEKLFFKWPRGVRVVPLRPLARGSALNTLLYAAAWWPLLFGLGAARRKFRRRAGRCPRCRYDLTGNTTGVCPECGSPAASASQSLPGATAPGSEVIP
jgi:hypothetical protein